MALKLSLDLPEQPKGDEFDVGGVALKNGSTVSLSDEDELLFEARNGEKVRDFLKGHPAVKVEGTSETKGEGVTT